MEIPESIQLLIQRLEQELDETEQKITQGLNRVQPLFIMTLEELP